MVLIILKHRWIQVKKVRGCFLIMEDQHNITEKDKFILTTVLITIFVGVLGLGLIGVIFSLLN